MKTGILPLCDFSSSKGIHQAVLSLIFHVSLTLRLCGLKSRPLAGFWQTEALCPQVFKSRSLSYHEQLLWALLEMCALAQDLSGIYFIQIFL